MVTVNELTTRGLVANGEAADGSTRSIIAVDVASFQNRPMFCHETYRAVPLQTGAERVAIEDKFRLAKLETKWHKSTKHNPENLVLCDGEQLAPPGTCWPYPGPSGSKVSIGKSSPL